MKMKKRVSRSLSRPWAMRNNQGGVISSPPTPNYWGLSMGGGGRIMSLPMGVVTLTTMLAFCPDLGRELEMEENATGPWEERSLNWVPHIPGAKDLQDRWRMLKLITLI